MNCKRCRSPMWPVKTARPEEVIEIDIMDFINCREVILWYCNKCGHLHITSPV